MRALLIRALTCLQKQPQDFRVLPIFHPMTRLMVSLGLWLVLSLAVLAEDWPQFRGTDRDNVWNETGILQTFPTEGLKVRWRTPVGSGWSSPVVVRSRVF